MEEFSSPNKMLDRLFTIHRCLGYRGTAIFGCADSLFQARLALRLHVPALKLLPLPVRCYNDNAKAATEPDASRNRARNTHTVTAQHEVRSTHGRIQRRRLHRL